MINLLSKKYGQKGAAGGYYGNKEIGGNGNVNLPDAIRGAHPDVVEIAGYRYNQYGY
jgi:hypothetical protein